MPHDPHLATPSGRPRARSLGIPFQGEPGRWNAITDVPGVEVGYVTLIEGEGAQAVRSGATAIHPRGRSNPVEPCAAGFWSLNGNGEMTGTVWMQESGQVAMPITITCTHCVGRAHAATVRWVCEHYPSVGWHLPVAAETYDGSLSDADRLPVTEEHVIAAIDGAAGGPIEEGSVGGGTGMNTFEYKAGSGTASRVVRLAEREHVVGVFVQSNFGNREDLLVAGIPAGREWTDDPVAWPEDPAPAASSSIIVIVGTDAPLLPHQCTALARRAGLGVGRVGGTGRHTSGDIFMAFSTGNSGYEPTAEGSLHAVEHIPRGHIDRFYDAVVQATEEAIMNALCASEEMIGRNGFRVPGFPRERVGPLLERHGRGAPR